MNLSEKKPSIKDNIIVKGARLNNLKNINVTIPRGKLVVITGLSGSGKSSLAYDTIFAEGQRRYLEGLSTYAKQFLNKHKKPEVDYIKGICPAIAINQKNNINNPKSTVGTATEIYDFIKILFFKLGKIYCPLTKKLVKKNSPKDVVDYINTLEIGTKILLTFPIENCVKEHYNQIKKIGFSRILINKKIKKISEITFNEIENKKINIIVDRQIISRKKSVEDLITESCEIIFKSSSGVCELFTSNGTLLKRFNKRLELNGKVIDTPNINTFNFNSPYGACELCHGYGDILGIDESKVIPNNELSLQNDAIIPWKYPSTVKWKEQLLSFAKKNKISVEKKYSELTNDEKKLIWEGNKDYKGINEFFQMVESKSYKIQYRVMLSRYRGRTTCPNCKGGRLKKETENIKFKKINIQDMSKMSIFELKLFFKKIKLIENEGKIANKIFEEIKLRLNLLSDLGLEYLTLNRKSSTLSGGETQRINIAKSLGGGLVDTLYVLDEPSVGLHDRDKTKLIAVLENLKKIGNTVLIVEHDLDIIKSSDYVIDLGLKGGDLGGNVIFSGNIKSKHKSLSYTKKYINNELKIDCPINRRSISEFIHLKGGSKNNIKNIKTKFPTNVLTTITGVSGSGKSTLISEIFVPEFTKFINNQKSNISFEKNTFSNIEFVKQGSIGKSSRSNLITYIKGFDEIRKLFSEQKYAKIKNMPPKFFSFNTPGGRCEHCKGDGFISIDMQFMSDIKIKCENCNGKRYMKDVLNVKFKGKNIYNILEMTVETALDFFNKHEKENITKHLRTLKNVGLGYVKLGQNLSSLSGGEAQRLKLASFLNKKIQNTIMIFDEPTTGLHIHDIKNLLNSFNNILKLNNTIIVIEHNMEIIKTSDWVIELGPNGGDKGGEIIFEGRPESMKKLKTHTSNVLKKYLN